MVVAYFSGVGLGTCLVLEISPHLLGSDHVFFSSVEEVCKYNASNTQYDYCGSNYTPSNDTRWHHKTCANILGSIHHAVFRFEKLTATTLTIIIYDGHEDILRV